MSMGRDARRLDPRLLSAATYLNAFRPVDPWLHSTGFRTNPVRYENLDRSPDPRLAEAFLVNSRLRRGDREFEASVASYFAPQSTVLLSLLGREAHRASEQPIRLPKSPRLAMDLDGVVQRRRSERHYTGDAIPLAYLAAILRTAAGVTAVANLALVDGSEVALRLRTTASGGGVYPIDLYIIALRVMGLPVGVYRFDPLNDALRRLGASDAADVLLESIAVPEEVISIRLANAVFLLIGKPWRSMRKYGSRGVRLLLLEAGAMAAHINLAVIALGLGSVDCASAYDDEVHEALALDGLHQLLVHAVIVGAT